MNLRQFVILLLYVVGFVAAGPLISSAMTDDISDTEVLHQDTEGFLTLLFMAPNRYRDVEAVRHIPDMLYHIVPGKDVEEAEQRYQYKDKINIGIVLYKNADQPDDNRF